jgi:type II secretory pathway pseudopilin PulG
LIELVVVVAIIVLLVGMTVSVGVNLVEKSEVRQTQNIIQLLDTAVQEWELAADRKLSYGYGQNHAQMPYDIDAGIPHMLMLPVLLETVSRSAGAKDIIARIDPEHIYQFDAAEPRPSWLISPAPDDPDPNANRAAGYIFDDGDEDELTWDAMTILDAWGNPLRLVHPGHAVAPFIYTGQDDGGDFSPGWTRPPMPNGPIPMGGNGEVNTGLTLVAHPWVDDDLTWYTEIEQQYGHARSRQICFVSAGPDGKFGDVSEPPDTRLFKQTLDNIYSYRLVQYEEDEDEPVWTGPDFIAPDPEARP